uniref:Uncharacterized protein n=1 Tax=Anguilla anguilla TaxID=7936 RepID=A0A0E9S945_ANGAN
MYISTDLHYTGINIPFLLRIKQTLR